MPRSPHSVYSRAPAVPPGEAAPGVLYAGVGDVVGGGPERQAAAVGGLGWQLIELRTVWGRTIAELGDAAFAACLRTLRTAGLSAACVHSRIPALPRPGAPALEPDLRELDRLGPRCAALGTRYVRLRPSSVWGDRGGAVRRLRVLAARAAAYGLVLLYDGPPRLLADVDRSALRLVLDTSNRDDGAYDRLARLLYQWPEAVAHVHLRATPVRAEYLRLLLDYGYVGAWSAEPPPGPGDPVARFLAYGRRLEHLVATEVLPRTTETVSPR